MLNCIVNNPFRVLGVFANASKKEIISSEAKIKAFFKVDKTVKSSLDSIPSLPPVIRTIETSEGAIKEVERPIDKLKALLFWYVEQTQFDKIAFNHLTSGNTQKAINIWLKDENFSSTLNLLTTYAITEDWTQVAIYADTLFTNYNYVENICQIVGETINYDALELMRLYLETICEESPETLWSVYQAVDRGINVPTKEGRRSSEWQFQIREVLSNNVFGIIESKLNEIESSTSNDIQQKALRFRLFYHSLKSEWYGWNCVEELSGGDSTKTSRLKNKVATSILQCAIDLYNKSEKPEKVANLACNLAKLSLSIAPKGSLIYQRCEENLNILNEICAKLPPNEVIYYDSILQPIIEEYQTQPSTIANASAFIKECTPYLMSIRSELGANHPYYVRICTRIADFAISDIISDYNEKSQKFEKQLSDKNSTGTSRENILKRVREMMKDALIAMYHIKSFGLDTDFYANRFAKNYSVIFAQARDAGAMGKIKLQSFFGGGVSDADVEKDLQSYPLDQRDEDGYFNSIKSLNDCYLYRKLFPNGKYEKRISAKVEEYEYKECVTIEDLLKFKIRYPSTKYNVEKKREEIIFKSCKTIEDYQSYLAKYSTYKERAIIRIDDLRFEQCNTRNDYANYLSMNPTGGHRLDALRKIDELDYRACKTIADFERYVKDYPHGFRVDEAKKRIEDDRAWQECSKKNSWKAYRDYLSKFPNGLHASDAKPKAVSPGEKFKKWRENNGCLLSIIIVSLIVLCIAGITNGILGIGYVFGAVAVFGLCGAIGKGNLGFEFRAIALLVGVVTGLIAYGLISWGEEMDCKNDTVQSVSKTTASSHQNIKNDESYSI